MTKLDLERELWLIYSILYVTQYIESESLIEHDGTITPLMAVKNANEVALGKIKLLLQEEPWDT